MSDLTRFNFKKEGFTVDFFEGNHVHNGKGECGEPFEVPETFITLFDGEFYYILPYIFLGEYVWGEHFEGVVKGSEKAQIIIDKINAKGLVDLTKWLVQSQFDERFGYGEYLASHLDEPDDGYDMDRYY